MEVMSAYCDEDAPGNFDFDAGGGVALLGHDIRQTADHSDSEAEYSINTEGPIPCSCSQEEFESNWSCGRGEPDALLPLVGGPVPRMADASPVPRTMIGDVLAPLRRMASPLGRDMQPTSARFHYSSYVPSSAKLALQQKLNHHPPAPAPTAWEEEEEQQQQQQQQRRPSTAPFDVPGDVAVDYIRREVTYPCGHVIHFDGLPTEDGPSPATRRRRRSRKRDLLSSSASTWTFPSSLSGWRHLAGQAWEVAVAGLAGDAGRQNAVISALGVSVAVMILVVGQLPAGIGGP